MNFSRSRNSTLVPTPRRPSQPHGASQETPRISNREPPPYQTPEFPPNLAAQRALLSLTRTHDIRKLENKLTHAQETLTTSAAEINEKLRGNTDRLERIRTKRQQNRGNGGDGEEEEDDDTLRDMEENHAKMRRNIESMTMRMDERFRKLVDAKQTVKFITESITASAEHARSTANTQASTQTLRPQRQLRRRRESNEEGSDKEEEDNEIPAAFQPTDPAGGTPLERTLFSVYKAHLDTANTRYQSHTLTDRYAHNNDYIDFRRTVHDALNPEDQIPLPPQNEWFNEEDGTVAPPGHTTRHAEGSDDEDEDIAIAKTKISVRCPLTLQELKDPITSKKCSHTFERSAIHGYIKSGTQVCPVGGCDAQLSRKDLEVDKVLVRKIRRIQTANQMQDGSDDEDEDGDDGRGRTQGRAHVIDEDDEDDDDITAIDDIMHEDLLPRSTRVKPEPRSSRTQAPSGALTTRPYEGMRVATDEDSLSDEEMEDAEDEV